MTRGALLASLFIVLVLLGPLASPQDPMVMTSGESLQPPSASHWLGTDALGRDVLSRVLHGGQRTLIIAAGATLIAVIPGALLGLLAASAGRWVEDVLMALVNALLAFPGLLLALVVVTLLGMGPAQIAAATGVSLLAAFARVTRTAVLRARSAAYVEASRGLGAGPLRLAFRHVLPNALPTLLAYAGVTFAYAVLNGAALSFLGLTGGIGVPDWGAMLYDARTIFRVAPWVSIGPGLGITLLVYSINSLAGRALGRTA
jgi:peptide/nickel transport system permease protein